MKNRKFKKGFTIVELVIVIGVIGILSAILIPTFVNVSRNADQAAAKANLANAYSAYAAEAADGVVDAHPEQSIVFAGQNEVALLKGGKYYTYNSGWNTVGSSTAPTKQDHTLTLVAGDYSEYNGYTFYYFAA